VLKSLADSLLFRRGCATVRLQAGARPPSPPDDDPCLQDPRFAVPTLTAAAIEQRQSTTSDGGQNDEEAATGLLSESGWQSNRSRRHHQSREPR
jgi:hypothetical protein